MAAASLCWRAPVRAKQRACMSHLDLPMFDELLHFVGQFEQAQQVADGRARAAHCIGGQLVRHVEFTDQPVERAGFLERVQVLALDVLDQRHGHGGFIPHDADHRGNVVQAGHLRGAPAAFPCDDLVAHRLARLLSREGTHHDGLHDALGPDRIGEVLQASRASCRVAAGSARAAASRPVSARVPGHAAAPHDWPCPTVALRRRRYRCRQSPPG